MLSSTRRETERLQRKETILGAAFLLFREKGYDNTSVSEIAEKAELGKGTLYYYFPDKEEILIEIVSNLLFDLEKKLTNLIHSEEPLYDAMHNIASDVFTFFQENAPFINYFHRSDMVKLKTVFLNHHVCNIKNIITNFNKRLGDEGYKEEGEIAIGLIFSSIIGYSQQFRAKGDIEAITQKIKKSIEIIYRGMEKNLNNL